MTAAWTDRQMPAGNETFLDHVGYFAHDLSTAGDRYARLGFQVSAVNLQYNADDAGTLRPSGTSNRLVKLRRGFLEILAATSDTPLADQLRAGLRRYEGLHVVALTNPDMEGQRARLTAAGFAMLPLVNLRRRIPMSEGEKTMAYTVLRTESDVMPEGRVQMLTTHTPELFWTPGVTAHANRADALTDLLICVEDPLEAADRFARFTDRPAVIDEPFVAISLDRGRILFASPGRVGAFLDNSSPSVLPYIAGQAVRSSAMDVTNEVLRAAGVKSAVSDPKLFCVGSGDALGACLLFHDASVTHPWRDLSRSI